MNDNLTVNEQYQEILFEISRQLNNGINLPIGIQIPANLVEPVKKFLDSKEIKYQLVIVENDNFIIFIAKEKDKSKIENFRFSYYEEMIKKFNEDLFRRKGVFRLIVHPVDFDLNQEKIVSLIDLINLQSRFAEYIYPEFISGNSINPPYLELKLEKESESIERVIKTINDYLNYVENFDFKPLKFKFSRKTTYEELVNEIEEDKLVNYSKWFNFKFTSYINGDIMIVEKKN